MSTIAYANLTNKREVAQPDKSTAQEPPGMRTYIDAFAALVPAEVLTLHGFIISYTTKISQDVTPKDGTKVVTTISDPGTLSFAFWGLIALSMAFYVGPRLLARMWDKLDWIRALIPPLAFTGWTMLQRTTAFDAAFPIVSGSQRTVSALFLGVILGAVAAGLAYKIDQKPSK